MEVWIPKVSVARRCAAKLITSHRGEGLKLTWDEEMACIDTISHPYVSRARCRLLGHLWVRYGREALAWEAAQPKPPLRSKPGLDAGLENVLEAVG